MKKTETKMRCSSWLHSCITGICPVLAISLLMLSTPSQGQTSIGYSMTPSEKTYIYSVYTYGSYYSSDYSCKVGRYQPNDQEVHKYRKGLRFNCSTIPAYATVTQVILNYNAGGLIGSQLGGIQLTSISSNFLSLTDSEAFSAIGAGSHIASKNIASLGTSTLESSNLIPIVQAGAQSNDHLIGIGIYNTLEFEGGGIYLYDCYIYGTYTIPTPAAVRNLSVSSVTATSCTVSWDAPLVGGGAGAATGYKVKKGGQLYTTTTSTSVQFSGLCPGTNYSFQVIPYNQYGDGPASGTSCTTLATSVTGSYVLCSSGGAYTINNLPVDGIITWNAPSSNVTRISGEHSNPCTFQGQDWGGAGWIAATITSATCGTYQVSYNIWSGRPWAPTVYPSGFPPVLMGIYSPLYVALLTSPGANYWDANWSSSGSISTTGSQGSSGSFYSNYGGTGYFYVTTFNVCGTGTMYQGEVFVDDGLMNMISSSNESSELLISPNPAFDEVQIMIKENTFLKQAKLTNKRVYLLNILNMSGNNVYSTIVRENPFRLPVSNLENGTYYIVVTNKQTSWKGSLVVAH